MAGIIKNINTILAKVKMGEIISKGGSRLFSKVQYAQREELTKPYLHHLDNKALLKSVDSFIMGDTHQEMQAVASRNKDLVDFRSVGDQMKRIWQDLPKEIVHDIFNIYYHDSRNIQFKSQNKSNKFRFQILEKSADPTARVMTHESTVKSMIFTRGMIQYYLAMMAMLEQEDPEKFEQMMDKLKNPKEDQQKEEQNGQGSEKSDKEEEKKEKGEPEEGEDGQPEGQPQNGDGPQKENKEGTSQNGQTETQDSGHGKSQNSPSQQSGNGNSGEKTEQDLMDEITKRFEDSKVGKQMLERVMENAKKTVDSLEKVMDKEEIGELWKQLGERDSGQAEKKLNQGWLTKMELELRSVSFSMQGLKEKIKHLLDKSVSYFSAKDIPYYDNIFEAESLGGLQDFELLHPKLRKIMMEDIHVKEVKKVGRIDIYVDVSGSMNSSCGVQDQKGQVISKVLFSKAMVFKMKEMNLLNEVYQFEQVVKYIGKTTLDILTIGGGGGTNLNAVMKCINENQKNAIVLTDAEDRCNIYSPYAYFIGVRGAQFSSFDTSVLEQYYDGGQMMVFDGQKIYPVDRKGSIRY